ncbi:MAG TPA: bifunctional methylenetetrahydrofolate dehydrogenase/methenyltetrahydrofolate cyclohydrolase FolD [Bryobacteraceae bacterium]|nr:bifunctional methylenetetrahydrofolate dehydrogenase/methenyltetrahydrofolate cyclohydrolase FolD [Bryobacteraceae bacterium]
MSAKILDGKWVREQILAELRPRVAKLAASHRPPGLAAVLVGNDPASEIYVRNKIKACAALGIYSEKITPPDTISTEDLLGVVEGLNQRSEIDGILVQVPLPKQVDSRRILLSVRPDKDVDGFHPVNIGSLVANIPAPRACTPAGILELLRRYEIPISGKRAVVVGRSDIVGKPVALLLLHQSATVTICHSKTADLVGECRRADILVAAIGKPALITREFIQPGAVVIDVGQNRGPDGKGLVGDVDAEAARELAGAYTPVPGGVGPLTIAMLMSNTVRSAEQRLCCS